MRSRSQRARRVTEDGERHPAEDLDGDMVFMARNQFILDYTEERTPGMSFVDIKDVKDRAAA